MKDKDKAKIDDIAIEIAQIASRLLDLTLKLAALSNPSANWPLDKTTPSA